MMDFDEFAERFLAGLYWETEHNRKQYVRASDLISKYNLQPRATWISRMADEWEHLYFKDVSKTLGGYDGWSFRISAGAYRKIEEMFKDDTEIAEFLELTESATSEASSELAPAAGRIVKFSDNEDATGSARYALSALSEKLTSTNDLRDFTDNEVEAAKREIWILEQVINQDAVRVDWIEPVAKATLQWIATKAAEQIVRSLALAVLAAFAVLFGFTV